MQSRLFCRRFEVTSSTRNHVVPVPAAGGIFFPLAGRIGRSPRETVSPKVLERCVWAGSNLGSFPAASAALGELAGVEISAKRIHRMTSQTGAERCNERAAEVDVFRTLPLVQRTSTNPVADVPELGVVMMDGGRHQRRDHFGQPRGSDRSTHWKEDKVGLCLSMQSDEHEYDPAPQFPDWLADAKVVREIARLGECEESPVKRGITGSDALSSSPREGVPLDNELLRETPWPDAPRLLGREMIASTQDSDSFGWYLEFTAWKHGTSAAARQAFVADGASVNWTIHRKHFSQMIGVLDLMHALSYAHRAAKELGQPGTYRRFAEWIWQGRVDLVIDELRAQADLFPLPENDSDDSDPRKHTRRAVTYYGNHRIRMNYPEYRRRGLPLTSSHIESAIKQINIRVKGTEKFWNRPTANAILQLRADSLSHSQPLKQFWTRSRANQTGANRYRKSVI